MKALLCLSAVANVVLGIALIWMHEKWETDVRTSFDLMLDVEERHMQVYALALEAIENPEAESAEDARVVLTHFVDAWEENQGLRQLFR